MAVTNLLDRFAEEYEGNHPVEYRAQLAKLGKKIGEKAYSLGGGAKGGSARDIIRKGSGTYPFDAFEQKRIKKRIDESKPWDFAVVDKNTGKILGTADIVDSKREATSQIARIKANNWIPGENGDRFEIIDNVKSNRLSKPSEKQKRDLDEFKKAFEDVRAQRDYYNNEPRRVQGDGDILANGTVREKQNLINTGNMGPQLYHVDSWDKWLSAKSASKEAGRKLGRLFAKQNQLEKNAYGNIAAGIGLSQNPVPEGTRPKYALGNQNHVYSTQPDDPQNYPMSLSELQKSGHEIHYRKDGTPIVDAYTWTQKPNIENIMKTGYLAIEGSDTENFHPGTKGAWTANVDNYPMSRNYDNGVEIFGSDRNGETFNEDLLHHRMPLGWYQKAPVIHQGRRGSGAIVDVIQAKPGAPEVVIGQGPNRRLEKVAVPSQFINRITEDKMRPDWAPLYKIDMLPGSHPNKADLGNTDVFLYKMTGKDFKSIQKMPERDKKNLAITLANNDQMALDYALKNVSKADKSGLQRDADAAFLEDYIIRGKDESGKGYKRLPYDLVNTTNHPPMQGNGLVGRGEDNSFVQWYGIERPRTNEYTYQKFMDTKKLSDFLHSDAYEQMLNNFYVNKFATKDVPDNSMLRTSIVIPGRVEAKKLYNDYLNKVGAGKLNAVKAERQELPGRSSLESPEMRETINSLPRKNFYKEELDDMKWNRSHQATALKDFGYTESNFVRKNLGKFKKLDYFTFDDWFDDYIKNEPFYKDYYENNLLGNPGVQQNIAEEKERVRPFVEAYLDNLKKLPSDNELAKKAYERTKRKFDNRLTREEELEFLKRRQPYQQKADSLDKVIGHTIGRRIGADRAKRGKKIF